MFSYDCYYFSQNLGSSQSYFLRNSEITTQMAAPLTEDELVEIINRIHANEIESRVLLIGRFMTNSQWIRIISVLPSIEEEGQISISFSENEITDFGIQGAILPLKKCKNITEVCLSHNEITDV